MSTVRTKAARRDEEVAGSNPVTPTTGRALSAGKTPARGPLSFGPGSAAASSSTIARFG